MTNSYVPGDIVAVRFPFSNFRKNKRRPSLIVAAPRGRKEVIVAKVSSVLKGGPYRIPLDRAAITEGFLPKASEIDIAHLYTLDASLIQGKYGTLSTSMKAQIETAICQIIIGKA